MRHGQETGGSTAARAASYRCSVCEVRQRSICGALSDTELDRLNAISSERLLGAGEIYHYEQDQMSSLATVKSGVVKLVRHSADGRAQIVGLLFPSDFIGAPAGGNAVAYGVEAVTPVELCVFPKGPFHALLQACPTLENKLLALAIADLERAREWMVVLGRKTAEERLATFLLQVAEKMSGARCRAGDHFELPLNRSDIADYIGLTLETVSRRLSSLSKRGIIEIDGKQVRILDAERMRTQATF